MNGVAEYRKEAASFTVQGDTLRADLYLPLGNNGKPPVIVMAHGFGGERRFRLPAFADHFAGQGMAVLLFDYRGFGDSTGTPRGLVDANRHLEDYAAAVAFARRHPELDGRRVALWGTSYSGGHVLVTAARLKDIAAVVAQVPHVDGMASALGYPPALLPKASWLASRDVLSTLTGGAPVRMPVVARSGVCCLAGPDCYEGYTRMVPPGSDWQKDVPARILFTLMRYRPVNEVASITAPVLMLASPTDSLIPFAASKKTAQRIRKCRLELIDGGHFDPYFGSCFEKTVRIEAAFLREKLGVK